MFYRINFEFLVLFDLKTLLYPNSVERYWVGWCTPPTRYLVVKRFICAKIPPTSSSSQCTVDTKPTRAWLDKTFDFLSLERGLTRRTGTKIASVAIIDKHLSLLVTSKSWKIDRKRSFLTHLQHVRYGHTVHYWGCWRYEIRSRDFCLLLFWLIDSVSGGILCHWDACTKRKTS